jgi:hypothetical protein
MNLVTGTTLGSIPVNIRGEYLLFFVGWFPHLSHE